MPAPRKPRSNPARFSQIEVEAWLADHPRHAWEAARLRLVESIGPENVNPAAIAAAHSEGLSWRQIAAVITETTGTPHTAGSIYNAYAVTQRK